MCCYQRVIGQDEVPTHGGEKLIQKSSGARRKSSPPGRLPPPGPPLGRTGGRAVVLVNPLGITFLEELDFVFEGFRPREISHLLEHKISSRMHSFSCPGPLQDRDSYPFCGLKSQRQAHAHNKTNTTPLNTNKNRSDKTDNSNTSR